MAPILPIMKFTEVAIKQIAKPVSQQLLGGALAYPQVTRFCVTIGQTLHYINVRVNRSAEGQSNSRKIFELPEDKARDAGALFLGEMIVFTLTGSVVAWQLYESSKSSHEAALAHDRQAMLHEAEKHAELLQRDLRLSQLEQSVSDIWKSLDSMQKSSSLRQPLSRAATGTSLEPVTTPLVEDAVDRLIKTSMASGLNF